MTDYDDLRDELERIAGPRPNLTAARSVLEGRVRRARRRRAAVRTGFGAAGAVAVVALAVVAGSGPDTSRVQVLGVPTTATVLTSSTLTTTTAATPTTAPTTITTPTTVTTVAPDPTVTSTDGAPASTTRSSAPGTAPGTQPTNATVSSNPLPPASAPPTSTVKALSKTFSLTPATITVRYTNGSSTITLTDLQLKSGWSLVKQEGDGSNELELSFRNGKQSLKVHIEMGTNAPIAREESDD